MMNLLAVICRGLAKGRYDRRAAWAFYSLKLFTLTGPPDSLR